METSDLGLLNVFVVPAAPSGLRPVATRLVALVTLLLPAISAGGEWGKADRPGRFADKERTVQYILLNRAPGQGMYQGQPETLG